MEGLGKFFLSIGVDVDDLNKGLNNSEKKIDDFGSKLKSLGTKLSNELSAPLSLVAKKTSVLSNSFESLKKSFNSILGSINVNDFSSNLESVGSKLSIGLSAPLALVANSALDASGNFESLQTSFNTMLGSVEAGKQMMQDLQKFNLSTPFESEEVAKATKSLLAFGFAQQDIIPNLRRIGDISSGVGMSVQELADIYGKARVQGTLMSEDINQLTGRGIPIIQEFAKQLGVGADQVKKLASEGKISFTQLEQAFVSLTSEGGKFFGMTANQANTWQGVMSNASDSITQSLVTLGDTIIKSLNLKEVIPQATAYLGDMVEAFKSLSPEAQKAITIIGGLAIVVPPILALIGTALPMLTAGFTALISPVGLVTVAVGALVAVLGEHYLTTKKIESAMNSLEEVNQRVSDSIRTEVDEVANLNEILKSNTTTYDEKKKALERLQQINPKYFSGLNAENINYSQLNKSISLYVENLKNAQLAKELADKLSKNQTLVGELQKNPSKGLSYAEGVGVALLSPQGEAQFKSNVKNIVDKQIRTIEQENLRMKHQLTNLKIKGYGVSDMSSAMPTAPTAGGATTATGTDNKALKKQIDEEFKLREGLLNDIQKLTIERITDSSKREIEMLKFNTEKEIEEYKKRIDGHKELEDLFASWKLGREKKLQDDIFAIQQKNMIIPKAIKQPEMFKGFDMKDTTKGMKDSLNNLIEVGTQAQLASTNVANLEKFLGLAQGTINDTNYSDYAQQAQIVLDASTNMKDALKQLSTEAITNTSIMIGEIIAGTESIKSLGMLLMDTISQALAQIAKIQIFYGLGNLLAGNKIEGAKQLFGGIAAGIGSGILKGMGNKAQNQQPAMQQTQNYSVIRGGDIFTAQNRYQVIKGF